MSNSLALWEMKASSFEEAQKIAKLVSNSSLCPSAYRSGPAGDKSDDVILASAYGATLGMSLMQSLSNISVINGHATVWGDALPAICRRSGKVRYIKEDFDPETMTATCTAARTDEPEDITHSASFSIEDARRANLVSIDDKGNINSSKGPWKQYPRRMLQMRARAYCLRDTFPDALQGIEVTEEVRDYAPQPSRQSGGFEIFRSRIDEAETLDDLNAIGASLKSARLSPEEKSQLREAWTLRRDSIKNKDVEDATINQ